MWSFWELESFVGQPDLVIIGSGIVGLTAAIEYADLNPNAKITILESGHLPAGASTKNAGFACYGSPTELLSDLENEPEDEVFALLEKRLKGLENLKSLLGENGIGYESFGSFEVFQDKDQDVFSKTLDALSFLNNKIKPILGCTAYVEQNEIINASGFKNMCGAIHIHGEGQIHTGKMMFNLLKLAKSKKIQIFNGITALSFESSSDGITIRTESGDIFTRKCLIATNGFSKNLFPDLDILPARAQVLITKPIKNLTFNGTFHFDSGYYYFRNVGDRVLFGGGRNLDFESETTSINGLNLQIQDQLIEYLKKYILPGKPFEIDHKWTGIMGIGTSKQVILKNIEPHLFVAIRLGGMGVAIGSLIGKEAAQMISD